MAITTNSLIEYFGTQDTVTSGSAAVTDAAFSAQSDIVTWVNDDDAPMASVTLSGTYSVAPTANTGVTLYARPLNTVTTNDGDTPDANFTHIYLGRFPLNDVTSAQYITIDVVLPNSKSSQEYEFYIKNDAGQTLGAGWNLYVTPKTYGPHA